MKKIIYLTIFILLVFIPIKTNAANINISLKCPTSANKGDIINCNINVTSDVLINGIAAKYQLNNLSYISFTPSSGFSSNYSSATGFSVGNNIGKKGTFTIGTVKVKVNQEGSISINNLDLSDTDFNSYSPSSVTSQIRLKSTNNNLSSLSISNGTLSPTFNANTTNYTSTINSTSVTINAIKGDNYQTISGIGTHNLKYGVNKIDIVVTSESGSKKIYTINITRPDNRNSNNNLKTLSTNQGTLSFNKNITTYNLNLESNISSITINGTLEDSKSKFVNGYGPRTINLNYGKNLIEIKVQAENETIKTYTINVTRKDNRNSNNYLKELILSSGKITFDKNVLEYNMIVDYKTTQIDLVATAEDNKTKIVVNNPILSVGNNIITIDVISENEQTRTYKIYVTRLNENEKISDNNNILSLKILGHDINFKSDVLEYELYIQDEYALVFEVTLEDSKASYIIEGNENLKNGSVIKVISTSESGQAKEYTFNIIKEEIKKNNDIMMYIICGIAGFILGVVSTLIVIKIKKKAMNNNN